jgi:sulfur relay (sulfurtransferase) complex TusBCD TusD component (DsrE family)
MAAGRSVLIASEDPFEHDASRLHALAIQLRRAGHEVTLFLVQNAVLAARATCARSGLPALREAAVEILADDFSLRERGIAALELHSAVNAAPLYVVIQLLAAGRKALWT